VLFSALSPGVLGTLAEDRQNRWNRKEYMPRQCLVLSVFLDVLALFWFLDKIPDHYTVF